MTHPLSTPRPATPATTPRPTTPGPTTRGPATLEHALGAVEEEAEAALRPLVAATKQARRAKSAAAVGQVRELAQALDAAVALADQALEAARELRAGWRFDVPQWFASGEYTKELLAAAAEAGLGPIEEDQRILCYPAVVEVQASEASVAIDKKKDRRVRPSVVVSHLASLRERSSKLKEAAFIESLAAAYDLLVAAKGRRPGVPVKLVEVHRVLTLRPGAAREYTKQELARDLYLLDQSGVVHVKDGRRMTLPASATTRATGAVLTTVTRRGQAKVYAAIAFVEPGS
ncbi:MAG: hypothetical protein ACRD0L_08155 [Acidimicrobiales bacterium]